jgi:hypothetical protein
MTTDQLSAEMPAQVLGMRTKDGRRRTNGGVFFSLVRGRVGPRERQQLFPRPSLP